jgi:hypothetical protein
MSFYLIQLPSHLLGMSSALQSTLPVIFDANFLRVVCPFG